MTADSAVPPTTDSERLPTRDAKASSDLARLFHETYNRLAPRFAVEDPAMPWDYLPGRNKALMVAVADNVIRSFVDAEVAAARADDIERIRAVCRLLLNSGDITPMGARLIEQAADRSVTSRLGAVRD